MYALTSETTVTDQHGRVIHVATVTYDGEVIGTIAAEPEGDGRRHVVQAITVVNGDKGWADRVHHSMPTQTSAEHHGAPTPERAAATRVNSIAWSDGYGFARWAPEGTALPVGQVDAFYTGVAAGANKSGRATAVRGSDTVITGRPSSF